MNPPVVGTVVVVDSTVEVVVKLEETSSAFVVVIVSKDVETGSLVDDMETVDVVAESNKTEIIESFVRLSVQSRSFDKNYLNLLIGLLRKASTVL